MYNWGDSILTIRYLLYGYGITNKAIRKFFDTNHIDYLIYVDKKEDKAPPNALFHHFDCVVKCPGIHFDTPFLKKCEELHILVISDLELLYNFYPKNDYVLVTGSNGKTTTSYLIYEMLKKNSFFKDGLGGNIGKALFSLCDRNRHSRGIVIEASSFMLHHTYTFKPKVYVLTNLVSHHLDYHHDTESYFYDKTKLIANLQASDYLIYNLDDENITTLITKYHKPICFNYSLNNQKATCSIRNQMIYYLDKPFLKLDALQQTTPTILYDMMAAILVAKIYHIPTEDILTTLKMFCGLPFRFQVIFNNQKLVIINDSKATSPKATYYALKNINTEFQDYYKTVILGGRMVDENYEEINAELNLIDEVYLFGESRFDLQKRILHRKIFYYQYLEEVIEYLKLREKHIILFSPSCVSYDQFTSYIKRGEKFNHLINQKINY